MYKILIFLMVKVRFALEQDIKAQSSSRYMALLFL
jgi:hypothetical protein